MSDRPPRLVLSVPMARLLAALAMLPAISACATAGLGEGDPLITDRPDFTESAQTVPAGMTQVEGGYTFGRAESITSQSVGELLARISIGPAAELRVAVNSYSTAAGDGTRVSGLEDASLGAKFHLATGATTFDLFRPDLALIVATSVPSGSSAYGESEWQPDAKLVVGWTLTDRLAWTSNLNYTYASEDGERFSQPSWSTSFGYSLTERVGTFAEYFRIMPESRGAGGSGYLNGGATYLFSPDFQFDARIGRAAGGAAEGYFAGIGLSRRW